MFYVYLTKNEGEGEGAWRIASGSGQPNRISHFKSARYGNGKGV
jgi:hypothetical protein